MSLTNLREHCLHNINGFCNRSDLSHEMKNRKVGQALEYMKAAHDQFSNGGCQQTKDDRGRCHAGEGCKNYRPGMFMPCHDEEEDFNKLNSQSSRVGQARSRGYGSRGTGACQQTKDDRGRCHAGENCKNYRPGMFMPCHDEEEEFGASGASGALGSRRY